MTPTWLQKLQEHRKIKEQEDLIRALRRRRPAAKFANQIGTK